MAVSTPTLTVILVTYVSFCLFIMYFCGIADPYSSKIAHLLQVDLPNKLWASTSKAVGQERMGILQSILDLALAFVYFFVVLGCWTVVFWYIYPWISESSHVGNYHKIIGYVIFLACFGSWRLTNNSRPGIITARNFKRFDHYPYDNLMFLPHRRCETTKLIRIPRSKYDRLKYHQNVPRYDHFCGWVHNTIGEENYRWFLLFLTIHVIMCVYGSIICILLLRGEIVDKKLLQIEFFDRATGEHVKSSLWIVSQYLFMKKTFEVGVLIIMFAMAIALGGFLGYHVYITSYNRTTNEDGKWSDIQKWYKKQQKKYRDAVKAGLVKPKDGDDTASPQDPPGVKDEDVSCTGGGAGIEESSEMPEYFDPGPVPKNIYDRGFVENWKEVLFPLSLREDALQRGGYSRIAREEFIKKNEAKKAKSTKSKAKTRSSGKSD